MSPKPAEYHCSVVEPDLRPDSRAVADDFDNHYAMYVLAAFIGLYLLITVLVWRGALLLARRLPILQKPGASRARKTVRLESASLD